MKYLDFRSYPLMPLPENVSIDYLAGMESVLRFVLSIDLQAVSLSAAEALDRVEEMQEAIIEEMQEAIIESMEVDT